MEHHDYSLRPKQAAEFFGISLASLWRKIGEGLLPKPSYATGQPRWLASELREWERAHRDRPRPRAKIVAAMIEARAQQRAAKSETV
jgi:predicted DNA-binding transcriptional regulator AlpA